MLSYSQLCETSDDKVDAAKLESPEGFKFLKRKWIKVLKNYTEFDFFKNLKRSV